MPLFGQTTFGGPKLLLWGVGGHANVVLELSPATDYASRIIRVDDHREGPGILRPEDFERTYDPSEFDFVVAIGDNRQRSRCYARALALGAKPITLIHPDAWISPRPKSAPERLSCRG